MIHIEQNQTVPENPNLLVVSVTGDYSDNDLIECATHDNPTFALCAFTAAFVKYGNIVNRFSDPFALGEALLGVDSGCTHDAAILFKEEDARRIKREGGDFSPENPVPADESLSKVAQDEALQEQQEVQVPEPTTEQSVEIEPEPTPASTPAEEESSTPTQTDVIPEPTSEETPVEEEVVVPQQEDVPTPASTEESIVRSNKKIRMIA